VKEILFKVKDNKLNIIVDTNLSNQEFLSQFKSRLERLIILKESFAKNVVLNIRDRYLNNREILQLFDILNDSNMFYLNKVICKNKAKDTLMICRGNFRGGQTRFFENSALVIGNINKGSRIIVNGDLYVLGKINGDVELKNKDSKIYCENISNSLVKIGDSYKFYNDNLNSLEIYLDNKCIKEKDYKKGEILDVKSDSCYIG